MSAPACVGTWQAVGDEAPASDAGEG